MSSVPRLILSMDGLVLREIVLDRERISIGRKGSNDIQIEDMSISGEHARITTILGDVFLEDLDSTNGTHVNGKPVTRRVLSDGDVVDFGKYRLKFLAAHVSTDGNAQRLRASAVMPIGERRSSQAPAPPEGSLSAVVKVLSGVHAGREVPLSKARTMLGKPGGQVVAITRRAEGFRLIAVEGDKPRVNGESIDDEGLELGDGAVFELAGIRMAFELRG
jgi:pSer/pThr/pTyr-binding forkhead associated (FHA) protein